MGWCPHFEHYQPVISRMVSRGWSPDGSLVNKELMEIFRFVQSEFLFINGDHQDVYLTMDKFNIEATKPVIFEAHNDE